jgi:hypothetical protein
MLKMQLEYGTLADVFYGMRIAASHCGSFDKAAGSSQLLWAELCELGLTNALVDTYEHNEKPESRRLWNKLHMAGRRISVPFKILEWQRCGLSSLWTVLNGVDDRPRHKLAHADSG